MSLKGMGIRVTRVLAEGRRKENVRALQGRGRKRIDWVDALNVYLRSEFDRLRRLGVKHNMKNLRALALDLIKKSASPDNFESMIHPFTEYRISEKVPVGAVVL